MEIELKLACEADALSLFRKLVLPQLQQRYKHISQSRVHLFNEYYDTPERFFAEREMGLRVRTQGERFEQTIKAKGQVAGGLHQRHEYNVDLPSAKLNLHLFDGNIWDEDVDLDALNNQVESLFSTDFTRDIFELSDETSTIELVFDQGEVRRESDIVEIREIELELIKGDVSDLFDVAEIIASNVPCRLSNQSKASRGQQLLNASKLDVATLPKFLALDNDDTTEEAFCKTLQTGLSHWQYHQYVFAQTHNLKALTQIRESISLLLQGVALYLPILQSSALSQLHQQLLALSQSWAWQQQLVSIAQLRSRKGPFSRRIPKSASIMSYLLTRREELIGLNKPTLLNLSEQSAKVQILASRALLEKPWRQHQNGADLPVRKHANGWLSQTWQTVQQSLPRQAGMDNRQYLALEMLLKQSLNNGFLLGELFADRRGNFRAPWLDLASGIEELKALQLVSEGINEFSTEDRHELREWIDEKTQSVIGVMEQTRDVAMNAEIYWQ